MKKRLKALKAESAQEGLMLSESPTTRTKPPAFPRDAQKHQNGLSFGDMRVNI